MAGETARSQRAPVADAPARRPGSEAVEEALAQLDYGEAPQIGVLGDTGCGKTTLMLELVQAFLRRSTGSIFIVDDKELTTRFVGQERRDRADLIERPIDGALGRVTIFRGDVGHGQRVDLEEIAELAWTRAHMKRKTAVFYDELIAGREEVLCKNQQWRKGVVWVPQSFTMGRSPGISDVWGAQDPVEVPNQVFNQSSAIFTFRLAGTGLLKLKERNYLGGGVQEVIEALPGPPLPPAQRGEFVLLRRGQVWNRKIYKFERGRG
jgi:ABC-type cobalamin/Fe3+-siderophores transport system ATPase subunit